MTLFESLLLGAYFACSLGLLIYGLNSYVLIGLFLRNRRRADRDSLGVQGKYASLPIDDVLWPRVTTQVAIFNEYNVAERVIRAVAAMEYAPDRHQIQILDDSTDETRDLVDRVVEELAAKGLDILVRRREVRTGYKAGALREALPGASGEFIAIFDSDFVPPADFLRRTVPHLIEDAKAGLVQARWGHLNASHSLLTRSQAIGIDGHFVVEQSARSWGHLFLNFNGTAGLWRLRAIEEAGGWEDDTLTEDMDLSYRAQLAGWRIHFDSSIVVPAELPETYTAFKNQQFRWAKGSIQTAKKLLPRVLRSDFSPLAKMQAFFHLTHYGIHLLIVLLALLALPTLLVGIGSVHPAVFWVFGILIGLAFLGPNTLYFLSQWFLNSRRWWRRLVFLPVLMCIGVGIAISNAKAVLEALLGVKSGFVRTPKSGESHTKRYRPNRSLVPLVEILVAGYSVVSVTFYLREGAWLVLPFLLLYAAGFSLVGIQSLLELRQRG